MLDSILCSLCSWIASAIDFVKNSNETMEDLPSKLNLCKFLIAISQCSLTVHQTFSSKPPFHYQPTDKQSSEFHEFYQLQFLDVLLQFLLCLWFPQTSKQSQSFFSVIDNKAVKDEIIFSIVSCLYKVNCIDVIAHVHLEPLFCADENFLPEDVQTMIGRLSPLITDRRVDDVRVHMSIHTVLSTLLPTLSGVYLSLSNDILQKRENDDDFLLSPPKIWMREISKLTSIVTPLMASDSWREHAEIVSSYLYVWLLVIQLTASLPSEVRPPMVAFLRNSVDFQAFLLNTFALAPASPKLIDVSPFESLPSLYDTSEAVPVVYHLTCFVIRQLLVAIPASVRSWLNDQPMALRHKIVHYVSTNLSPSLRAFELSKVKNATFDECIQVRVMTKTGEMKATYQADSFKLDLTISLPEDFPLSVPSINQDNQNLLNNTAKLWLRQLSALLIYQVGILSLSYTLPIIFFFRFFSEWRSS